MIGFLLRMAISALGLWLASALVPGMRIEGALTLLAAALVLGFVNGVVRPILVILTFPLTVLTLGLFLWVVNAAMLSLVAWLLGPSFQLESFWSALFGSMVVGLTSWLASQYIGPSGRVEVMVVRSR